MKGLRLGILPVVLCFMPPAYAAGKEEAAQKPVLFENEVAPILRSRCWKCHGLEDRKAGLDLRTPPLVLKGSDKNQVIVPGAADKSLMFQKASTGAMPPGKLAKLTPEQVATLRRWIDGGAKTARTYTLTKAETREVTPDDRKHWAFQKLSKTAPPQVRETASAANPIDRFLLEKLEVKGLSYAPQADPYVLIRRASLDLTGLPPSPEEVAAFVADRSPDAYAKLVDKLLASPHFGERWARHWLDAAGYSDLQGSDLLNTRQVKVTPDKWRYRDYVVKAFNIDKPYDRFLHEQLAGDELVDWRNSPKITPEMLESIYALGFLRCASDDSNGNMGAALDARFHVMQLTIQNVTSNVMGLTVACAQCHSHKFDPIPQVDYYKTMAVFAPAYNIQNWVLPKDRWIPGVTGKEQQEMEKFNEKLEAQLSPIQEQMAKVGQPYVDKLLSRQMRAFSDFVVKDLKTALALDSGKRDAIQKYLAEKIGPIYELAQKMPPVDQELLKKDIEVRLDSVINARRPGDLDWKTRFPPIDTAMDENETKLVRMFDQVKTDTIEARDIEDDDRTELQKYLFKAFGRISVVDARRLLAVYKPEDVKRYLAMEEQMIPIQQQYKKYSTIPALYDVAKPYPNYLLRRGDLESPVEEVGPGVLSVLDDPAHRPQFPAWDEQKKTSYRRLTFARWLTEPDTPASALVSRVMVNKIWMHLFGEGLVSTADNFGRNGTVPTHPALLDWMAGEFIAGGWHVKPLIKQMMMSGAYRQATARPDAAKALAADPGNKLLWQMRMKRLESEIVRDELLAVAGTLDRTMGGQPIRLNYRDDGYVGFNARDGKGAFRRSLYLFTRRGHNLTMLKVFDQPAMDSACVRRNSSSVVLQSLTMLNGEDTLKAAASASARILKAGQGTPEDRVKAAFRVVLAREPQANELAWSTEALAAFDKDEKKAVASLCHTLMNTSEFLYVP